MSCEHNKPQAFSLRFYVMINTPNHVINIYEIQCFNLWRLQTSWTTEFRYWHLQSLCDKDASYFSRILHFLEGIRDPACQGFPSWPHWL